MTKAEKNAYNIVSILQKAGYQALFAGGYVRDKVMKRDIHDIDIATDAKPDEIKKVLEKNKIKHIEIGESFGVVAAVIPKNKKENFFYEIATFRQDIGVGDGRHPEKVKLISDPREDAVRRDFTINGLFMMNKELRIKNQEEIHNSEFIIHYSNSLEIVDHIGGLKDIEAKIIRFIGNPDERIREDALRMMRAIRFACQLDFQIEEKSLEAIIKNKNLIKNISYERIRDEMNKILASKNRKLGIELLDKVGILNIIIPELEIEKSTPQPKNMHFEGDVWKHTMLGLERIRKNDDYIIGWSVLLHDIAKPITIQTPEKDGTDRIRFNNHDQEGARLAGEILRRMKFSNDEVERITWAIKNHMIFGNFPKMRESTRIRYLTNPYFLDLLELFWVDANSSVRSTPSGKILPAELSAYNNALKCFQAEKTKPKLPKPILRGDEVMKMMGIESGNKLVGEILHEVFDAQLEKKVKNKKEAKEMARKMLKGKWKMNK